MYFLILDLSKISYKRKFINKIKIKKMFLFILFCPYIFVIKLFIKKK